MSENEKKEKSKKSSLLKRILKIFSWTVGIILALLILALIFINPIVETVINKVLPGVLKVPVSVDSVNISPFGGRVEIYNFVVGNPDGYSSSNAAVIGEAVLDVDVASVFGSKLIIEDVTARNVNINIDMPPHKGKINLLEIVNNLNDGKDASPDKEHHEDKDKKEDDAEQGIELDNFELDNVGITFITAGKGSEVRLAVKLDPIKDLGKDRPEGLTSFELTLAIVNSIITQSSTAAINNGLKGIKADKLREVSEQEIKNIQEQSGKLIDGAAAQLKAHVPGQDEAVDELADKAKDAVDKHGKELGDKAMDAIGNLFK